MPVIFVVCHFVVMTNTIVRIRIMPGRMPGRMPVRCRLNCINININMNNATAVNFGGFGMIDGGYVAATVVATVYGSVSVMLVRLRLQGTKDIGCLVDGY